MRDPEFIDLRNRFFTGVVIALLIIIPLTIFFYKNYGGNKVLNKIRNKDEFVVLLTENDCSKCKEAKTLLKEENVKFIEMNVDKNRDSKDVLDKFEIKNSKEVYPIIVYVKDGKMVGNLFVEYNVKDIKGFLKFHKLS